MAPLTWRNVNAPDFASSARILGNAGRGLSSGVGNISGAFKDARARQINTRSNEGIGQLAGATTESDVERIMAEVLGSVSARDRNGALNTAIMGSNGRALGLDGDRADIRNVENQISNRNAASSRAASAAEAQRERQARQDAGWLAYAKAAQRQSQPEQSTTADSLVPVVKTPVNTGENAAQTPTAAIQATDGQTVTVAPVTPSPGNTAGDDQVQGGSGEDTLSADGFRTEFDAAMDRIINGDVRPGDAELFNLGANPTFDPTIRSLEGNRAAFDDTANSPELGQSQGTGMGIPVGTSGNQSQGTVPDGYNGDPRVNPNSTTRPSQPSASMDRFPFAGNPQFSEFTVGNENFGQGYQAPGSNGGLPGPEGQSVRLDSPEQERAQVQDRAFANASQPSVGAGSNSAERSFSTNGGIAGAFQNGSVTPSGSQVTDMTTLTSPAQQAQIDQVIEENTDPTTGQPASPEASDRIRKSVFEIMEDTGANFTFEQINTMVAQRQGQIDTVRTRRQNEYTANVEEQLYGELQKRGANGVEELTQIIRNNPDLSPRDREAYQSALKRFVDPEGNNAGYFTSTGTETFATEDQTRSLANDESFVTGQVALADGLSFDTQNLDLLGSAGDVSSTVDAVVASGDDGDLDRENVRSLLQEYHSETELPYSFIASQLDASLTGTWLNTKMGLSRDILDRHLGGFLGEDGKVDASRIARIRTAAETRQGIQTDMTLALSEIDSIDQEYRVLLDRPKSPEVDAQIEELRVKHAERMTEVTAARREANSLFGPPPVLDENGNPVETPAPDPTPEPVIGGADTRFQVPASTGTRLGYEVDPEASAWDRNWNQVNADAGVRRDLRGIRKSLAVNGASYTQEIVGSLFDNFQPRADAEADSGRREGMRVVWDWYNSDEATQLFNNNPMLLEAAREDPEAFYQRVVNSR
jgi:hypothetical protein